MARRHSVGESLRSGAVPARGWRIAFLAACGIGFGLAADLLRLHVRVHTDPGYQSYCAISERLNCDSVALSPYSVFAGLPVALWGLFGYGTMMVLASWGLRGRASLRPSWPLGLLFGLALFSAATGLALFGVAHWIVGSLCLSCAATYLVSLGLVGIAALSLRSAGLGPLAALRADLGAIRAQPAPFAGFALATLAVLIVTRLAVPPYWEREAGAGGAGVRVGETRDGAPWMGAATPTLEVIEFSDYQCPYCERAHFELRRIIEMYPGAIRLVHRHYPLDPACNPALSRPVHPHACRYARLAACAGDQNRFWEANDYLFANGGRRNPVTSQELATAAGLELESLEACLAGEAVDRHLRADLEAGRAAGVRATPTFVAGGEVYTGGIPREVLRAAVQD